MSHVADIISPHETEAAAWFCPKCSSPVDISVPGALAAGERAPVSCVCGWSGNHYQLVGTPFKHGFKSDDEIAQQMMLELRNLLAKTAAQTYGSFLLKWGFLDKPISALQLATYLEAIAKAVTRT